MGRAVRYRAWKGLNGRWRISRDREGERGIVFAFADTLAGVLDCPQLQLLRDKEKRMADRYGRSPAMTLQAVGLRAIARARRVPPGFDH